MSIHYPSMSRVTDIAHEESISLRMLGPRSFTASELTTLMSEVLSMEAFLELLSTWVMDSRTGPCYPSTYRNEYSSYSCLKSSPGTDLMIGELVVTNCSLHSEVTATAPTDAAIGVVGAFDVKLPQSEGSAVLTTIASMNISTYALHSFLRALPAEVYHAMGSLLEEIASSYYKGQGPISAVTTNEVAALVRLQDKITKAKLETAARTQIGSKQGYIMGPEAYAGVALARQHAVGVVRQIAPAIAGWLFDDQALGSRAFSVEESA